MRTGRFIKQLSGDVQYKAFIPSNLPFDIKIDPALQDILSKADIAIGRLDGIAENLPDVDFFILMYIRKEATLSSQIEGTQATFSDVLKVESRIEDLEIHNDVDEIINYINALNYGIDRLANFPMSLPLIKEIHGELLKGVRGDNKSPGEFRASQNWVGGSSLQNAVFIPPPVFEMKQALDGFEKYMHDRSPLPVLIKTGLLHYQFETIHPFLDGNGRIGRLLITFYLYHRGFLKKPLLYISEYFKKYRNDYYFMLNAAREKDDIEGWLKFFLEGVRSTSEDAIKTIREIIKLKEESFNKLISSGRKNVKGVLLLNYLFRNPYLTIKRAAEITSIRHKNALNLVNKFKDLGILSELTGRKRNRIYSFEKYIKLFS